MSSRPSTTDAPIFAVLAIVLVMLGAYVGGYFWFGERSDIYGHDNFLLPADRIVREYPHRWMVTAFKPVSFVEATLLGYPVHLWYEEPSKFSPTPHWSMTSANRKGN